MLIWAASLALAVRAAVAQLQHVGVAGASTSGSTGVTSPRAARLADREALDAVAPVHSRYWDVSGTECARFKDERLPPDAVELAHAGLVQFDPAPGQLGWAVILGHADSVAEPAVFCRLVDLKVGNLVIVKLKDGKTV